MLLNTVQYTGQTTTKTYLTPNVSRLRNPALVNDNFDIDRKKKIRRFYENIQPGELPWSEEGFWEERSFELRHEE